MHFGVKLTHCQSTTSLYLYIQCIWYLTADVVDPEKIALKIGDKITVNLPLKNFMEMQKDPIYGGWDDGLGQVSFHYERQNPVLYQLRYLYTSGKY